MALLDLPCVVPLCAKEFGLPSISSSSSSLATTTTTTPTPNYPNLPAEERSPTQQSVTHQAANVPLTVHMYRGSSPIFDVPEFPALRSVKPLPKRRRTTHSKDANRPSPTTPNLDLGFGVTMSMGVSLPGPNATAEDLLHVDSLSAQMALQSYYMPILGDIQELFAEELGNRSSSAIGLGIFGATADGRGQKEEDGDYIDHLQHPGNTKKRKVPANTSAFPRGQDAGSSQSGGEDDLSGRSIPTGRGEDIELAEAFHTTLMVGGFGPRKGKITPTTLAGLQHKEMLKNRKRQLAAVLGALSHGDTLALDQALSGNFPFITAGLHDFRNSKPLKVRLSRRQGPRRAREMRNARENAPPRHPDMAPFPKCEFTFTFPSKTSDRLVATKEEVALLRSRFEAELARQAAKAAKLAAASRLMAALPPKGSRAKRTERAQQRARTGGQAVEETTELLDQSLFGGKPRGKKKKRSALANASNPHHLKNYVPSRLPHSGQTNHALTNGNSQNYFGNPPLRFLTAEIPPRRWKKQQGAQLSQVTNPVDEWICPFCEYDLFWGDEIVFRRAVRMRRKILRRRRRARERAAAAASGNSTVKVGEKGTVMKQEDSDEVGFENYGVDNGPVPVKHGKWKGDVRGPFG